MPHPKGKWWRPSLKSEKILLAFLIISILVIIFLLIGLILHLIARPETCTSKECIEAASDLLSNIDETADPCNDFYKFACGSYSNKTNLLEGLITGNYDKKMFENLEQLRHAIEKPWKHDEPRYYKLIKDFYVSCMNVSKLEERGITPLLETLKSVGSWPVLYGPDWNETKFSWPQTLIKFRNIGVSNNAFFYLSVVNELSHPSTHTLLVGEPVVTFPHLSYYKTKEIRDKYLKFMVKIAISLGAIRPRAEREMHVILDFETLLAEKKLPPEEKRNITKLNNKRTVNELQRLMPQVSWVEFINSMKPSRIVTSSDGVIVTSPNTVRTVSDLLSKTNNRIIANYIMWKLVWDNCHLLNKEIADECLKFRKELLGGRDWSMRKHYCTASTVFGQFDIASGALFVKHYFDRKAKKTAVELVDSIKNELRSGIANAKWMDPATKDRAKQKLEAIKEFIAYPDELLDDAKVNNYYDSLQISKNDYFKNVMLIEKFETDKTFAKLNKRAEELSWMQFASSTAAANAGYNPLANRIEIYAGILSGIFLNPNWPKYLNYGGIGNIIGHEFTHGFDDKGKQFGMDGNLYDWWANDTAAKFREKADLVVRQYSNFIVPEIDMALNGINVQGEAISDIEGVKLAYKAFEKSEKKKHEMLLPGLKFTTKQLFWLKTAQVWCASESKETLIFKAKNSAHPPSRFRVLGPLMNSVDFSKDFNCPADSPMNPDEKISFW